MAKSKQLKIYRYFLIAALPILFFRCANQMSPGGGEVDKIPPEIIEVYPEVGTTNFSDNYFEITFSEYVDKRSVQDAIFISPAITISEQQNISTISMYPTSNARVNLISKRSFSAWIQPPCWLPRWNAVNRPSFFQRLCCLSIISRSS